MVLGPRTFSLSLCVLCLSLARSQTIEKVMSSKQMKQMHVVFDLDGNGKVSMSEGVQYVESLRRHISSRDTLGILQVMDVDKDGQLSLVEFQEDLKKWDVSENDRRAAMTHFKIFDSDEDQVLNREELPKFFHWLFRFRKSDTNGDGALTLKEFKAWASSKRDQSQNDKVASAEEKTHFKRLDADGDGYLSLEEFMRYDTGVYAATEALRKLFEVADTSGDKHLSAKEMVKVRESSEFHNTNAYYHLKDWIKHNGF
eukprot:TRINITY_DN50410_c0_g1_i1.p1 TRINITY_DN50410_c0_g1~~TRINITY_DN50410_c0_g1_i1.p1  ORF type:complete len:270 (-),score=59.33 TRINITY_DN50410_c0_g1_i1:43-810(-)